MALEGTLPAPVYPNPIMNNVNMFDMSLSNTDPATFPPLVGARAATPTWSLVTRVSTHN